MKSLKTLIAAGLITAISAPVMAASFEAGTGCRAYASSFFHNNIGYLDFVVGFQTAEELYKRCKEERGKDDKKPFTLNP